MKHAKIIFLKELTDFLRDKRSRNSTLIMPMFIIIFLIVLLGYVQQLLGKPTNQQIDIVHSANMPVAAQQFKKILESAKFKVEMVPSVAAAKQGINDQKIKVALNFIQKDSGSPLIVDEYYDPNNQAASIPKELLDSFFRQANMQAVKVILKSHGIPSELAEPFKPVVTEVTHGKASGNQYLIGLLPYLIVVWAFYGGMGAVGDLVAGEKEKNTLETLLLTPATRTSVAAGKLLALGTLCLGSSLSSLLGVVIIGSLHLGVTKALFAQGIGITLGSFLVTLAVLLPTVLMFASLLLSISAISRNVREAYSHLAIINILVLTPAILSQFIGYTDFARSSLVSLVPVLNAANTMREALSGTYDYTAIFGTMAVNGFIGVCILIWTIKLFNREDVLLRV